MSIIGGSLHTIPTWQQQRHYLENETQVYTTTTQWDTKEQVHNYNKQLQSSALTTNEVHTAWHKFMQSFFI